MILILNLKEYEISLSNLLKKNIHKNISQISDIPMKLIKENTILYFKFMSSKFKNSLKKGAFSNEFKVVKVELFH